MKKVLVVVALICAMVFMIGCGGDGNKIDSESTVSSGSCTRDEAYYKIDKCIDGESYSCECEKYEDESDKCEKYHWVRTEICKSGCNSSTGKCDKAECSIEQADARIYECKDNYSFKCKRGEKDDNGEYHSYWHNEGFCPTGCNPATGRCQLCDEGSFACSENTAFKCLSNGSFEKYEFCDENGCNSSTGKCKNSKYCEKEDEGKTFCSGDKLAVCENGRNTFTECKGGCDSSKNQCKPWKDSETGLTWSSMAPTAMFWQSAVDYCDELSLGGYSDWHLPTIGELGTLFLADCEETASGESCGVTDECLSYSECYSERDCRYYCQSTENQSQNSFWSSSLIPDKEDERWSIKSKYSEYDISPSPTDNKYNVYCVR